MTRSSCEGSRLDPFEILMHFPEKSGSKLNPNFLRKPCLTILQQILVNEAFQSVATPLNTGHCVQSTRGHPRVAISLFVAGVSTGVAAVPWEVRQINVRSVEIADEVVTQYN